MGVTYEKISTNTLSTTAASVTFSSIPGTFTDLILKVSARNTDTVNTQGSIRLYLNGSTSSVYSFTRMTYDGSAAATYTSTLGTELFFNAGLSTAISTGETYGNAEIYIPNYTSSLNKIIGGFQSMETNNTTSYLGVTAGKAAITSAITTIEIVPNTANFAEGSSFYLYGIKNS